MITIKHLLIFELIVYLFELLLDNIYQQNSHILPEGHLPSPLFEYLGDILLDIIDEQLKEDNLEYNPDN